MFSIWNHLRVGLECANPGPAERDLILIHRAFFTPPFKDRAFFTPPFKAVFSYSAKIFCIEILLI